MVPIDSFSFAESSSKRVSTVRAGDEDILVDEPITKRGIHEAVDGELVEGPDERGVAVDGELSEGPERRDIHSSGAVDGELEIGAWVEINAGSRESSY